MTTAMNMTMSMTMAMNSTKKKDEPARRTSVTRPHHLILMGMMAIWSVAGYQVVGSCDAIRSV